MKNPNELDVICHKGRTIKTLTTEAAFYVPKEDDECPFREPSLSRLDLTLLIKDSSKTDALKFNIPAKEITEIKMKTEIALNSLMNASSFSSNGEGTDDIADCAAFTVQLMLNDFKNRTPGDVLAENPANKEKLLEGKKWLQANLAKYPANKKQIDAIDEAIKLLEIGELTGRNVSKVENKVYTIYERKCKHKSTKNSNGNNLIYSISVTCDLSKDFPFEIKVMNCYAPVITNEQGQTVVKMSAAENIVNSSIAVSDSEWIAWLGQAYDLYQNFKRINAPVLFKRVASKAYTPA